MSVAKYGCVAWLRVTRQDSLAPPEVKTRIGAA
jgi:hypothetical protein